MLYLSKPVLTLVLSLYAHTDYIRYTFYMDHALEDMRQHGMTILPEDIARLFPIGHEHINVYGKYSLIRWPNLSRGQSLWLHILSLLSITEVQLISSAVNAVHTDPAEARDR